MNDSLRKALTGNRFKVCHTMAVGTMYAAAAATLVHGILAGAEEWRSLPGILAFATVFVMMAGNIARKLARRKPGETMIQATAQDAAMGTALMGIIIVIMAMTRPV